MIVPTSVFDALKWITIGGFVLSIVAALVLLPKNVEPGSARAKRARKPALAVLGALVACAVVAFGVEPFGARVVIVRRANGSVEKTRGALFGTSRHVFADGHEAKIEGTKAGTTIVNDGTVALHVETDSYGDQGAAIVTTLTTKPLVVAPMSVATFEHRIDFIGPDDPPPPKVQGVYAEERYWLTW